MVLTWTDASLHDLDRIREHLAPLSPQAAARVVRSLTAAPKSLIDFPRIGAQLKEFEPRQIHRIFVDDYEIRYEIMGESIIVLRVWHAKEDR
jgi:plasmid stabilization system protein ParE